MSASTATETSPLLAQKQDEEAEDPLQGVFPIQILAELIGARHLPIGRGTTTSTTTTAKEPKKARAVALEPYCVAQFGSKTLHRTKPFSSKDDANPIWTIKESPLFVVSMAAQDLRNNKKLKITVWGRQPSGKLRDALFLGKIRIKASDMLDLCDEERVEMDLVDELDRNVKGGSPEFNAKLALRFRFASQADVKFAQAWSQATANPKNTSIPRTVLEGTDILPQENRKRATTVSEMEGWQVSGARLSTAVSSSFRLSPKGKRMVCVKPCPDPNAPDDSGQYMLPEELKAATEAPSREWVEVGSGTLGRLYVEILSCHALPNVDYGNAVGNITDAFVCAIYGDAMAQTSIIDDELSPHWPAWTQRAFCFSMMHPSQVLYLGVFGYKRGVFNHVPIGRVEINPVNFQRDHEYTLEYDLFRSYHVTNRTSAGRIRIRLRMEIFDERAALFAALRPCPAIYVNCRKKASLYAARYTALGEYDNLDKFSLKVLLAYIDEFKDQFLRRILYSMNDGVKSLVFWRVPFHSLVAFCAGIVLVEHPQFIPAFVFLGVGYLMLVNMSLRLQSPSPWRRCNSYWYYLTILVRGSSTRLFDKIEAGEGAKAQEAIEEARQKREEDDDRFFTKKEAVEKEIESIESISVQSESKAIISLELLVILGKIQGIVGTIVRYCRAIDVVIRWEESDLSFWVTTLFLCIGFLFLFVPWAFLLKWTSRCAVVLFLGPQNKLIDLFLAKHQSDEGKLRQMFEERMFRARCRQEDASKLRGFRHVLFGKFGIAVPSIKWTPHLDHPRPESEARAADTPFPIVTSEDVPCLPGQKLHGLMVPRPHKKWLSNSNESNETRQRVVAAVADLQRESPLETQTSLAPEYSEKADDAPEDEGFEVSDLYDLEAGLGTPPSRQQRTFQDSLKGDWGVEAVDLFEEEALFVEQRWSQTSLGASKGDMLNLSTSSDDDDDSMKEEESPTASNDQEKEASPAASSYQISGTGPDRVQQIQTQSQGSQRELDEVKAVKVIDSNRVAGDDEGGGSTVATTSSTVAGARATSHVRTMKAERGASLQELGVEIVAFDDDDDDERRRRR